VGTGIAILGAGVTLGAAAGAVSGPVTQEVTKRNRELEVRS